MHIFSRIESAQGGMRNAKPFQIIFSSQCRLLFLKCTISLSLHFVSLQSPFFCYIGVLEAQLLLVSETPIICHWRCCLQLCYKSIQLLFLECGDWDGLLGGEHRWGSHLGKTRGEGITLAVTPYIIPPPGRRSHANTP